MKKFLLVALVAFASFTLFACGGDDVSETLIIYQNKVEIDNVFNDYAEAWGAENGVNVWIKTCGGDGCQYAANLVTEFASRNEPDIFVFEGLGQFNSFRDKFYDMTGAAWIDDTEFAFTHDGAVYGFPVNLEGWGMAYNADILEAAGIDPAGLVNRAAYQAAFDTLVAQASSLGITAPVSMAAGTGLTWVTGLHNFNGYLSSGLDYDDDSVINDLNNGIAHRDRLEALADWVELLFDYAHPGVLIDGDYDDMINAFKNGEVAFLHQGNWVDPSLLGAPAIDFNVGYAPHASGLGDVDSIFVAPPSYYAINKDSDKIDLAIQFLNDLALTQAGHEFMVNDALYMPAFSSVDILPDAPLTMAMNDWIEIGQVYAWWQNDMPDGFGMGDLGPIYGAFAAGNITKEEFIDLIQDEIEALGN